MESGLLVGLISEMLLVVVRIHVVFTPPIVLFALLRHSGETFEPRHSRSLSSGRRV